ncbi:MFS transporter [Actinoplanes sp. NPDC026670]|uniref:MFS transporter n=1 Tax=Actinoplanes sp. NPDC026670 TaxID=3154700 RepID=UPI0033DA364A
MFRKSGVILATVALVQFMVSLDLSVVNVGLPRIAAGLGFSTLGLTWVIHAYALTFGGLLLLGGKAADRYGRKRLLLIGLAVFAAASLAGGFAQQPGQLVAARAAQGIGAAALAPAALALLSAAFPGGRPRVRAFGVWAAVNAAGGALGVLIGGLLTEYAGWRWVMFVSVPMALAALAMASRVDDVPPNPGRDPDVAGALLATSGMLLLVYGIVRTEIWPLIVAVALLAGFVAVQRRTTRDPLIRFGLLANRSVAGANLFNLLAGAAMASAFYFASLYLQQVLGHGPALTGVMFLPFALAVVAGAVAAVRLGYRLPGRALLIAGGLVTAAGFALFGRIGVDGSFAADVLAPSVIAGFGFGFCLGPVVSIATAGVADHESGTASGLLNSSRQVGAALGLAVLGTVADRHPGAGGYALGLTLCAVLMGAAVLIAVTVLPRRVAGAGDPQPAAHR